jgi:acetyl-CoA acetyltransferase family protein
MPNAVVVSAVRTAIGTSRKGSLVDVPAETLARTILAETIARSGLSPELVDDVILAESLYGGGDLARHAAVEAGLDRIPGQAVNRHCAGSLASVSQAAGSIRAGMDRAIVAGGAHSGSMMPRMRQRTPLTDEFGEFWMPPTHPDSPEAPNMDMSITVGWNTAKEVGISREEMDAWALRSHMRAIEAIDAGRFKEEILPIQVQRRDGTSFEFAVDEYARRDTTMERLAGLKVLHPEIEGFSITAGNACGSNDAAAALMLVDEDLAKAEGLTPIATIRSWAAVGVDPRFTGLSVVDVIPKVVARAGVKQSGVALWEINEAFASVPIAACKRLGIDEATVNISGSGCSLGHPVAASGARMLTTLVHALRRRGGGIGVATMCAGGGQAGAVLIQI